MFVWDECPHLPPVAGVLGPEHVRGHRLGRSPEWRRAAGEYAQSLWRIGKPAQALLQVNRMLEVWDGEPGVQEAYRAVGWILVHGEGRGFFGNPVRHYQHLATRVGGEDAEARSWRAWACFHLARKRLCGVRYPFDEKQVEEEGVVIPGEKEVLGRLGVWAESGELAVLGELLEE